jgi:hypothetical protein
MIFRITPLHIKLLAFLDWNSNSYNGGPYVDTKRPFGNKYCAYDIYEIGTGSCWDYDLKGGEMSGSLLQKYNTIYQ